VLRTSFGAVRGEPLVEVHEAVEAPFEVLEVASEEEARQRAAELAREPFELSRAPLAERAADAAGRARTGAGLSFPTS